MKKTKAITATAVTKEQRNKATICATVSPWLKKRLEKMVDGKEFSSVSDIVSLACHEFMIRYFSEEEKSTGVSRTKEEEQ